MKGLVEVTHLTQMVDFPTWSRTINGVIKESTIDHIYISNPYQITNIDHNSIIYTDHELITFKINQEKNSPSVTWKRGWRKYSKDQLCQKLTQLHRNFTSDSVQAYWNELENQLVNVADELVPMVKYTNTNPSSDQTELILE